MGIAEQVVEQIPGCEAFLWMPRIKQWEAHTKSVPASDLCWEIYTEYLGAFNRLWGLNTGECLWSGINRTLFTAEFMENGPEVYSKSILLPLRNAFYSMCVMGNRWENHLSKKELKTPLLDYGCGVGFSLVYLKKKGFKNLYGYELPGPQHRVMSEVLRHNGIKLWRGEKMETVLCSHVLEHVEDPEALLEKLRGIGNQLYANCDESPDPAHIAPSVVRERVNGSLRERGELSNENGT